MIDHDDEIEVDVPAVAEPAAAAEPAKPAGERKAVEVWAAAKGMLPEFFNRAPATLPQTAQGQGGVVAIQMAGLKAPVHNPKFPPFHAAQAMYGWAIGAELTEQEFDDATKAAMTQMGG